MGKKEDYMRILELEVNAAIDEADHLPAFYRDMVFTKFKTPEAGDSTQKPGDGFGGSKRKNRMYSRTDGPSISNIS